jgi:azurin
LTAAYAALLAIGPDAAGIWSAAAGRPGHLRWLLEGVPALSAAGPAAFGPDLARLIVDGVNSTALEPDVRAAGLLAIGQRADAASAALLARHLRDSTDLRVRESAATALYANSALVSLVPAEELERVVGAIHAWVVALAPADRTRAPVLDALALGEALASRLPAGRALEARRSLRALGAQVVRITALVEQVSFDRRWFAVEAGRPVQVVLVNPDAMPHNVVIGRPGSLERIGTSAGAMQMPTDPAAKPFVPDLPEVLFSTRLAQQDETLRLAFTAPNEPGAYVFACTFPGHWVRMYGVMLVVPNLEAWEAAPTVPNDPITGQPFAPPGLSSGELPAQVQ